MAQDININENLMLTFSVSAIDRRMSIPEIRAVMYDELTKLVREEDIAGVNIRGNPPRLVEVMCETRDAKEELKLRGITIGESQIFFDEPGYGAVRITVHNAPLDMPSSMLTDYLTRYGTLNDFKHQKYFHNTASGQRKRTDWRTGIRSAMIKLHNPRNPVPPSVKIKSNDNQTHEIVFYHDGQDQMLCRFCHVHVPKDSHECERAPQKKCFNCDSKDHFRKDCPFGIICKRCRQPGHMARDCPGEFPPLPTSASTPISHAGIRQGENGGASTQGTVQRDYAEPSTSGTVHGEHAETSRSGIIPSLQGNHPTLQQNTGSENNKEDQANNHALSPIREQSTQGKEQDENPTETGSDEARTTEDDLNDAVEEGWHVVENKASKKRNITPEAAACNKKQRNSTLPLEEGTNQAVSKNEKGKNKSSKFSFRNMFSKKPNNNQVPDETTVEKVGTEEGNETTGTTGDLTGSDDSVSIQSDCLDMHNHEVKVHFVGGSNTVKLNMEGDEDLKVHLKNLSQGGLRIKGVRERIETELNKEERDAMELLVVHVGTNNLDENGGNNVKKIAESFATEMEKVSEMCPNTAIIFSAVLPLKGEDKHLANIEIMNLNHEVRQLCTQGKGWFFQDHSFAYDENNQVKVSLFRDVKHLYSSKVKLLSDSLLDAVKMVYFNAKLTETDARRPSKEKMASFFSY